MDLKVMGLLCGYPQKELYCRVATFEYCVLPGAPYLPPVGTEMSAPDSDSNYLLPKICTIGCGYFHCRLLHSTLLHSKLCSRILYIPLYMTRK